jgi:hypothetical protein
MRRDASIWEGFVRRIGVEAITKPEEVSMHPAEG